MTLPLDELAARERREMTALQWYDYWASLNQSHSPETQTAQTQTPPTVQPKDKDEARKARDAGRYVDSTAPFNPIVAPGKNKETIIDRVGNKKASVTDVYKMLWIRTVESLDQTKNAESVELEDPEEATEKPAASKVSEKTVDAVIKPGTTALAGTTRKPQLKQPMDGGDTDLQKLLEEMNKLLIRINETAEEHKDLDHATADPVLYRRFIDTVMQQRRSREDSLAATQDKLFKQQEVKQNIYKKMCELRDEQIAADKASGIANSVSTGLTIAITALFVVSVVATIATGGLASPVLGAAMTVSQGVLGVGQAAAIGFKGYYDYQSNKHERDLYGQQHYRGRLTTEINSEIDNHRQANEWVTQHLTMIGQVTKNRRHAIRGA